MTIQIIYYLLLFIFILLLLFFIEYITKSARKPDLFDTDIMELRTYTTESLRELLKVPDMISLGMGNRIVAILLERYDARLHILENSQKCEHLECKNTPCIFGCKKFCNVEKIKE